MPILQHARARLSVLISSSLLVNGYGVGSPVVPEVEQISTISSGGTQKNSLAILIRPSPRRSIYSVMSRFLRLSFV